MRAWQISLAGAVLTALLLAALFPPLNLMLLAPVALAPLLFSMAHEPRWGQRFLWGWVGGIVYWLVVCYWIGDVLAAYGGLNRAVSLLALVLFASIKALHLGVFAALSGLLIKRKWAIPAIAALWTGIERTHAPLGFAWLDLGNAAIGMGLPLRVVPFTGVYGASFVLAALGTGVALVALKRERKELLWLAPLAGLFLLPPVQLDKAPKAEAVATQTNVPGDFAWTAESKQKTVNALAMRTLSEAMEPGKKKPALLLWPEAPAPFYYYDDPEFRQQAGELARVTKTPFLFGTVARTAQQEPLNSAVLLNEDGMLAGRYDKVNLVPFGEFIPPGFGWIQKISSETGNYAQGAGVKAFAAGNHTIGTFICYESVFPHYIRGFANAGAEVLINLTNDGYYGTSAARAQHLLLARMRAVENHRWILRPANDGITVSIDPAGRVWDQLPEHQRLSGRLRFGYETVKTFYTRFGDWFAWTMLVAGLLACAATQIPTYEPPE